MCVCLCVYLFSVDMCGLFVVMCRLLVLLCFVCCCVVVLFMFCFASCFELVSCCMFGCGCVVCVELCDVCLFVC